MNFPNAPLLAQERWENQSGYSPGDDRGGDSRPGVRAPTSRAGTATPPRLRATRRRPTTGRGACEGWTATTNGPYSPRPYYLRLTKDGKPNSGTTYNIGDSGPTVDQRKVVDPSYLELVRLGVKRANDPAILNTVNVVDQQLAAGDSERTLLLAPLQLRRLRRAEGRQPLGLRLPQNSTEIWSNNTTIGRNWPIFGGERGEYELLDRQLRRLPARGSRTWPAAANDGHMLPEQVWAPDFPPAGEPGFPVGRGHLLGHAAGVVARAVRAARWSIDAGHPVERPAIVASRYAGG